MKNAQKINGSKQNKYTIQLFEYIYHAPENIIKKYYSGIQKEIQLPKSKQQTESTTIQNKEWYQKRNHTQDCIFYGFMFKNNRVFAMNIYTYNPQDNYTPQYLDITCFFNRQLENYNIFHTVIILATALKSLYRESSLTEQLIPYIENDSIIQLPKIRHKLIQQRGRYRKFIEYNKSTSRREWNKILLSALEKVSNLSTFKEFRNMRPSAVDTLFYTQKPKLYPYKYSNKSPKCV